jgi:hypothetical protein
VIQHLEQTLGIQTVRNNLGCNSHVTTSSPTSGLDIIFAKCSQHKKPNNI